MVTQAGVPLQIEPQTSHCAPAQEVTIQKDGISISMHGASSDMVIAIVRGLSSCYSLNQREALDAVLLDGRLELTNNLAERSVKPFVMSRRNFLFCDPAKGATSSALCFSMIETAKANNLDPFGYLLFLLQELPKLGDKPGEEQLRDYLPWSTTIPAYCRKK